MEELNKRIAALSPAKRAVLLQRLQEQKAEARDHSILRRGQGRQIALSFAQERLWFLDQLEPNGAAYNIPIAVRVGGDLNVPVIERCLGEIIRRHEVLRTRFEAIEGQPRQVIDPSGPLEIPLVDLSGYPREQREAELMRLCGEEARRPFSLGLDRMLRAKLYRLDLTEQVFFLNVHHIAFDGWSLELLFRELGILYEAFVQGKPSPLPELPVQYGDFAVWQRESPQGKLLEQQLSYWRKQLQRVPELLELPADRPRPATQSYRGANVSRELPKSLSLALMELSSREGATLFMTLMTAVQTLIHRYTNSEDVAVGSVIAGRNRSEVESIIGLFVNTLVFRGDLSENPSFRTLLRRTREVALAAHEHQELPFDMLVQALKPKRDMSYSPLFQVMFVLQNAPRGAVSLRGLEITPIKLSTGTSKFDLTIYVTDEGGLPRVSVEYSTDLFNEETIRRMLGHFQTLLEGIVLDPDKRLSDLPLLTGVERKQLLEDWNRTEVDYPKDRCLHELIEEQAGRTPEAKAVVFEGKHLTYRQLNERANQLARHLRKLGVGPDILVGICMERSLEMLVGLLGILKAGGAYVPLDPGYPKERLAFMLADAGAPVFVTHSNLEGSLTAHTAKVVRLDVDWPSIAVEAVDNLINAATTEHLAYMIYTSGSTGRPKGAMNTHRAIVNRLLWMQDAFHLTPADRVLQKTPFSFDVSVWEFFWPLLTGATLVVAVPGGHMDGEYLANLIGQQKITTTHFVPSMLSAFLEQEGLESSCSGLKRVICSGEALPFELQERFFSLLPAALYNLYGPTEAAVDVTYWACERKSSLRVVPIGRPIANTQIHILDRQLQPTPIGVPGELHIGGIGLARGYHNRPELTAEKFIPDPFRTEPGARLYKTGDLARYLPDGAIEYLGRLDHQVKIRGFRVELEEIESVLGKHPEVRDVVVVVREDVPGDKRLTAYLTVKGGLPPKISALRGLLQTNLPEYMVPATFVILETLPLTLNGKVDRKALPVPEERTPALTDSPGMPSTPTEELLKGIWREILGLKAIGIHDNFFDLGGHSLLAVRLQARVDKELGRRLPLTAFFKAPTVHELALLLADASVPAHGMYMSAPQSSPAKPPLFYLHFLTSAQRLANHLGPARPFYAIAAPFDEELRLWHEKRRLAITMEELASRCVPIIRRIQPKGPYRLGGGCFGGTLAFEVAHQLKLLGEEVAFLTLLDAFYIPGCRHLALSQVRRWAYHGEKILSEGLKYPATKLRKRRELAKKRRLELLVDRTREEKGGQAESESIRLPQAEFLSQILKPYRAKQYAGNAVLIRSVGDPFFEYDPGATNGWEAVIRGDLQVEELACGHLDVTEEPHVAKVAAWLEKHLSALDATP